MGHLGDKFSQLPHSRAIGSGAKPKLAQTLCGSPDFGDPATDATVPPRATPPYPLYTFAGLRTNFSSINPSDRASVKCEFLKKQWAEHKKFRDFLCTFPGNPALKRIKTNASY